MNTERRHAIIRTLKGRLSNGELKTVQLSTSVLTEIVGELDGEPRLGIPTPSQRKAMVEVLAVYMHTCRAAEMVLDAMLAAAGRTGDNVGQHGEKVSGFSPFATTR